MALSAPRDTPRKAHPYDSCGERGVNNATTIYAGGLVCKNASGYVVPGATATTLIALGRAQDTVTNSGSAGAVTVRYDQGVFRFDNSSAGDAITIADIGSDCFVVDDQQVAKTNGTSTRSRAGKVYDVDALGVWVLIGIGV